MSILETSAAAVGRLALAAAFDGPSLSDLRHSPGNGKVTSTNPQERMPKIGFNVSDAVLYAVVAAGWLSERRTLRSRPLDKDAGSAVAFKDLLERLIR